MNSVESLLSVKGVAELTPIQWAARAEPSQARLDCHQGQQRRPAGVVRSILATIEGTRELDTSLAAALSLRSSAPVRGRSHSHMRPTRSGRCTRVPDDSARLRERKGFAHQLASWARRLAEGGRRSAGRRKRGRGAAGQRRRRADRLLRRAVRYEARRCLATRFRHIGSPPPPDAHQVRASRATHGSRPLYCGSPHRMVASTATVWHVLRSSTGAPARARAGPHGPADRS